MIRIVVTITIANASSSRTVDICILAHSYTHTHTHIQHCMQACQIGFITRNQLMMINLLLFYVVFELVRSLTLSYVELHQQYRKSLNQAMHFKWCSCVCRCVKKTEYFIFENYVMNSNEFKKVYLANLRKKILVNI